MSKLWLPKMGHANCPRMGDNMQGQFSTIEILWSTHVYKDTFRCNTCKGIWPLTNNLLVRIKKFWDVLYVSPIPMQFYGKPLK
jgi:hypothetical protein